MRADVTVIIPTYNVEDYIEKCLESLEQQTYKNFEAWIIDDGSPDNSKEIAKKFVEKDSRFKLKQKENGGYGSVLQYGIKNIKSKYFLICDPDDWLAQNALEKLYSVAEEDNLDMVVGNKFNVYENTLTKEEITTFSDNLGIKPNKVYEGNEVKKLMLGLVSPHSKLFKTKIARNIIFPHHVSYTDFILYIKSVNNASRAEYIDIPLSYYLIERPGNTTTDARASIIKDYIIGWEYLWRQLSATEKDNSYIELILYKQIKYMLTEYRHIKNQKDAIPYLDKIYKLLNLLKPYEKNILSKLREYGSLKDVILCKLLFNDYLKARISKIIIKK